MTSTSRLLVAFAVMTALPACGSDPSEASKDSSVTAEAGLADGNVEAGASKLDGGVDDATMGGSECILHHDCAQREFCHRGRCRVDEEDVFHCGKPGCPPGHWCVESDGTRARCAEDLTFSCGNACDCGPAHCCIDEDADPSTPKRCVRHAEDPWSPGAPTPGANATCVAGSDDASSDATYCTTQVECASAYDVWFRMGIVNAFRAHDPATGRVVNDCGDVGCAASSCDCPIGHSCVETLTPDAKPGGYCGRFFLGLTGGIQNDVGVCLSHAIAESVFAWPPEELLDCCQPGCAPGERCELGWLRNGTGYDYERVVGVCPPESGCVCGDRQCCPEELSTCAEDCAPSHPICGNGICESHENRVNCLVDCPRSSCGNGLCEVEADDEPLWCPRDCNDSCPDSHCSEAERRDESCPADCQTLCGRNAAGYHMCGDGFCDDGPTSFCAPSGRENCINCPRDCGECECDG